MSLSVVALLLLFLPPVALAETVYVARFGLGDLQGWEEKSFLGDTRYGIVDTPRGRALRATARGSASGLLRRIRVDLTRTPWLYWSWRVDRVLSGNDERRKTGDDYPARLYVVVDGGPFFWRTRAVNYVWSSNQPAGAAWPNAFSANARMIALRSAADAGHWRRERRNVREDLRRLFGEDIDHIDAVAVMTDGDNTGQTASALYGDIYFASE